MKKNKRLKWIIGSIVIAGSIFALSFLTLEQNSVYFYTPVEAAAKAQSLQSSEIRVGGMVKGGSVDWNRQALQLKFTLSDLKGKEIEVNHTGTPPDLFKENAGVVVEGRIAADGSHFHATKLMVKHSEEYKKPEGGHSMDRALLEKSIFKNEAT